MFVPKLSHPLVTEAKHIAEQAAWAYLQPMGRSVFATSSSIGVAWHLKHLKKPSTLGPLSVVIAIASDETTSQT